MAVVTGWVTARDELRASPIFVSETRVLIHSTVRLHVMRDFHLKIADLDRRPPEHQQKKEEPISGYVLGELKPAAAQESDAPEYFVYAFAAIGKQEQAARAAREAAKALAKH